MQNVINFKQSLDYYLKLIDTRVGSGDFLGALDSARRALENAKTRIDSESINILIGQIYFEMKLYPLSCEHFFRAVRTPETRASAFFGIAKNLVLMGNYKLALDYFSATLDTPSTQDFAGAVLEWTHKIRENLSIEPKTKPTLAVAKNLVKMKKFEQAISLLSPLAHTDYEAKIYLADVLVMAQKYTEAREILFGILHENPADTHAILVLCSLCFAEKDFSSLEINLQKIDGIPLNLGQYVLVGNLFSSMGNFKTAKKYYQKAISMDEYNIRVMLYIAICFYNENDFENAMYYLNQARWVDIENPILNAYHEIFSRKSADTPLAIKFQLPTKIAEKKVQNILSVIDGGNFCDELNRSLFLSDDIEWCFTITDSNLSRKLASALSRCKRKKALKMYRRFLLSIRLNREQKFYLTKYAILNENFKAIDLNVGYRYRSFNIKIPSIFNKNNNLRSGFASAVSFAEVYDLEVNFDKITRKIAKNLQKSSEIDGNLLACLYFCENAQVLNQACIYFGVEGEQVFKAINEMQLLV